VIIWIASYPKSGNTWLRLFLSCYSKTDDKEFNLQTLSQNDVYPNLKVLNALNVNHKKLLDIIKNWIPTQEYINLKKKVVFLKTHNSMCTINNYQFTNNKNTLGGVYLVRDPRDVALSYADHLQIDINQVVDNMLASDYVEVDEDENGDQYNKTLLGSWAENYNSWKTYNGRKILIIKYEDMILDPFKVFLKVIKYLNEINGTIIDENKIKNSIKKTSFQNLRMLEEKSGFPEKAKGKFFFRKGKIGDWKDNLEKNLVFKIEEKFKNEMKELEYL
jgi:hypothetical protein